ncbi:DnaJ_C domain-containing protein [Cephalotus follicularis]|uniref:DnaJ_C domain-containing protein n=1 Tax=Cephalotus follicularis TaxID=3775 RepID=A0A1Q3BVE1_CEPFO|nr:DnaJ_C domain-containing protein [Cephalotus follicularis]
MNLTNIENQDLGEEERSMNGVRSFRCSGDGRGGFYEHKSMENCFPHIPSCLSRSGSRRSSTPTRSDLCRDKSHKSSDANGFHESLSRNASRRSTTPIFFSNSTGMVKPPPIEKKLECTLEELRYGCLKKINFTRDVITNTGELIQKEELLTINVKTGWKNGTKITFEGMGDERPGTEPADVIFVIDEKRHPLFRREGDDLELAVEIPLVKALTGCTIAVPLLGGDNMTLTIDEVINPGHEKIILGQGMPRSKEQGQRGNLKVVFLIEFPNKLTDEQRSDIVNILEGSY